MYAPCRCLARPPSILTLPSLPRVRIPRLGPLSPLSAERSHGVRVFQPWRTSENRWKVAPLACFVHKEKESSSFEGSFEFVEITSNEESEEPKADLPSDENNDWTVIIGKALHRFFKLHDPTWTVPWTAETIVQVMLLWIVAFWAVGSWIVPFLAHVAGFSKESLTHRGQALLSLLTDVAEGLAGIVILRRCLARYRPLPADWFRFSLKGTWHFDVGLGCLLFPLVNLLSRINLSLVSTLPSPPVGVSSVEQSIVARDPIAMALYAVVVSICAPIWEEIVFRGFLLPSLTKYMPLWSSVLVSAIAFALAHFNAQRLLPLVFLGVVMGTVFARSKNLLAPMLLHSLWNSFIFLDLMK